jgi:hypothetical protein
MPAASTLCSDRMELKPARSPTSSTYELLPEPATVDTVAAQ